MTKLKIFILMISSLCFPALSYAIDWSITELHWQHGAIKSPGFRGGLKSKTDVLTLQHANGWQYGQHFFFIDYSHDDRRDGFNDSELYMEYYGSLSLSKMSEKVIQYDPLKDISLLAGFNIARNAKVRKYLPGIRLSWKVPGFKFFNTDITGYIDDNRGLDDGGAPRESDSYMFDVNWAMPFSIGRERFALQGHIEYIGSRSNELGLPVRHWILAQPQFRWDAGYRLFNKADQLFIGIEYQWWQNKLGADADEHSAQALIVWRF